MLANHMEAGGETSNLLRMNFPPLLSSPLQARLYSPAISARLPTPLSFFCYPSIPLFIYYHFHSKSLLLGIHIQGMGPRCGVGVNLSRCHCAPMRGKSWHCMGHTKTNTIKKPRGREIAERGSDPPSPSPFHYKKVSDP